MWEPRPRGDGSTQQCGQCGSPALGAMGRGLRGLIAARAPLLQGEILPTGECLPFVGAMRSMWEPRPRGDGLWSAGLDRGEGAAPTRERLPTRGEPAFCGSPALGAMGCGLRGLIAARAPLLQICVQTSPSPAHAQAHDLAAGLTEAGSVLG
jgi:hypothetical protein